MLILGFLNIFKSFRIYLHTTGGMIALLFGIAILAIVAISYGSYSYPASSINSLSPTPLAFVSPLSTIVTLRMFAYRGHCTIKPLTSNMMSTERFLNHAMVNSCVS